MAELEFEPGNVAPIPKFLAASEKRQSKTNIPDNPAGRWKPFKKDGRAAFCSRPAPAGSWAEGERASRGGALWASPSLPSSARPRFRLALPSFRPFAPGQVAGSGARESSIYCLVSMVTRRRRQRLPSQAPQRGPHPAP